MNISYTYDNFEIEAKSIIVVKISKLRNFLIFAITSRINPLRIGRLIL